VKKPHILEYKKLIFMIQIFLRLEKNKVYADLIKNGVELVNTWVSKKYGNKSPKAIKYYCIISNSLWV